mgnify:CR=1 FL=1
MRVALMPEISLRPPFTTFAESVGSYLGAVGIRVRVRSMERAAFLAAWRDKKLQGIIAGSSAALGNAATRLEAFVVSTGAYAYGGYPDIDELFRQQAGERDRSKREALLHQIQRLMHERVMHGAIWEPATLHGVGPRVEESGGGVEPVALLYGPYEDMSLKKSCWHERRGSRARPEQLCTRGDAGVKAAELEGRPGAAGAHL